MRLNGLRPEPGTEGEAPRGTRSHLDLSDGWVPSVWGTFSVHRRWWQWNTGTINASHGEETHKSVRISAINGSL
jgi:hypothetical protein